MKVLLTGGSSFTGVWFAQALAEGGAQVIAPLRRRKDAYAGLRGERIARLERVADLHEDTLFGSDAFLELLRRERPDVLCHHAAHVENYRSEDFDVAAALAANTAGARELLAELQGPVVLTASVFEPNAGAGSTPLRAFSPYGLSKAFTSAVFAYHCERAGWPLHRFTIPNPFGPLEEPRFCSYLVRTWSVERAAEVRTPAYVRDNVPVSLLSRAYARFVTDAIFGAAAAECAPSFYVETQGAFAERFAREMRPRLDLPCELRLLEQTDWAEPSVRINTQPIRPAAHSSP